MDVGHHEKVVPAYAGVILTVRLNRAKAQRGPRIRGGDPYKDITPEDDQ